MGTAGTDHRVHMDMDIDMGTPCGDCVDRPLGTYGYGYGYAVWRLCRQTTGYVWIWIWVHHVETVRTDHRVRMDMDMGMSCGDRAGRPPGTYGYGYGYVMWRLYIRHGGGICK